MRRVLMALLATTFGTALLVALKVQVTAPTQPLADAPLDPGQPTEPGASTTPLFSPSATAKPGATVKPSATAKPGVTVKPSATARPTATKTTAPAPVSRTIVGTAFPAVWEGENYGNMQVKIVVTGTHIDSVVTIQQSNRPKTVASVLGAKAVSLQSANVGNVSGATASSDAYKKSLQSAINKI